MDPALPHTPLFGCKSELCTKVSPYGSSSYKVCLAVFNKCLVNHLSLTSFKASFPATALPCFCIIPFPPILGPSHSIHTEGHSPP